MRRPVPGLGPPLLIAFARGSRALAGPRTGKASAGERDSVCGAGIGTSGDDGGAAAECIEASSAPNAERVRAERAKIRIAAQSLGAKRFLHGHPHARWRQPRDRPGGETAPHRRQSSHAAGRRARGLEGRAVVPTAVRHGPARAAAHAAGHSSREGSSHGSCRPLSSRAGRGVLAPAGALARLRPMPGLPGRSVPGFGTAGPRAGSAGAGASGRP